MKKTLAAAVFVLAVAIAPRLAAQSGIVYTNQACFCAGALHIVAYDAATGAVIRTYSAPTTGSTFSGFGWPAGIYNGRGVVVVGNTIYYTEVNDPKIYMLDKTTGLPLGSITTGVLSMSTIGWDGSQFWTSDYTGNNNAYRINLSGVTTQTVSLGLSGNYYDGLEYFNGKLIANRFDGGYGGTNTYDIYDLSGNLLTAGFINATNGTGIAYDGTNFLVSNVFGGGFGVYNGGTGAFMNFVRYADFNTNIEDLSVDYSVRQDTATVPEPSTVILMMTGLFGVAGAGLVRRHVV